MDELYLTMKLTMKFRFYYQNVKNSIRTNRSSYPIINGSDEDEYRMF